MSFFKLSFVAWIEIKVFLFSEQQENQLPRGKYVQFRKIKLSASFLQLFQPLGFTGQQKGHNLDT